MTLDAVFRPLATRLLSDYGKQVTYITVFEASYDTATGQSSNSETSKTIYTYQAEPDQSFLAEGSNTQNLADFLISAEELGSEPQANDKLQEGAVLWTIESVRRISSGAQNALYICTARR